MGLHAGRTEADTTTDQIAGEEQRHASSIWGKQRKVEVVKDEEGGRWRGRVGGSGGEAISGETRTTPALENETGNTYTLGSYSHTVFKLVCGLITDISCSIPFPLTDA